MSQIKINIGDMWRYQYPSAWNKMIAHLDKDENYDDTHSITAAALRRELKKSGARWLDESETIVFPSEKNYAHWLLRWS